MDFVLVGPWPPYRGGIAHFTSALAGALRERGHHASGISFSRQYPDLIYPGRSQLEPDAGPPDVAEAPQLLDAVNPGSWWRVGSHVRSLRPDAVVFQHWMPFFAPAYGTVARRLVDSSGWRPRRLAVVHNALPHERRPGDLVLSRYFFRTCDGLVALSASVRDDLMRMVPGVPVEERTHPVYSQFGPSPDRAEARRALQLPSSSPILLFFGFIRRYKGLDLLLDALPAILARHPETVLVVAGEFYEDEQRYRAQVKRHGLEEHVRFESGYIPGDDVPLFFGAADVVVQPYRSATQSGVAQLAFGFGVPVITTDVGGLSEAIPHGRVGLVVPPEDSSALGAAVISYLDDETLQARLREGTAEKQRQAGWDSICEGLEFFLREDANNGRRLA